ncbi:hypothetical protein Tco_1272467 [Tanacetum coccineum]
METKGPKSSLKYSTSWWKNKDLVKKKIKMNINEEIKMRSGNDIDADNAYIRHIYDEQLTADNNVFATGQQHTEQPEFNNE